jgi:phosphatidylglycerophosphate synthase
VIPAEGAAPRSVRESIDLLRGHQKTPRGVSVYSLRVNRPLGRVLAAVADRLDMSPNEVTLLSGASSLCGVALIALAPATPAVGVLVSLLLVLGFALDSADGQLARLRGGGSRAGELLDHVLDLLVKMTLHLAVLLAWWNQGVSGRLLLVPLAFQVVSALLFFGGTLAGLLGARKVGSPEQADVLRSWLLLPVDHGVVCLSFLVWGFPSVFTAVYVALLAVYVVGLVALGTRWFRELG